MEGGREALLADRHHDDGVAPVSPHSKFPICHCGHPVYITFCRRGSQDFTSLCNMHVTRVPSAFVGIGDEKSPLSNRFARIATKIGEARRLDHDKEIAPHCVGLSVTEGNGTLCSNFAGTSR